MSIASHFAERRLELAIALVVVLADQATKWVMRGKLGLHESIEIVPNLLNLTRVHNTGAAFGMLNTAEFAGKPIVITLVALLALAGVAWFTTTVPLGDRFARVGVAGILGGAIGNLIDRATAGYVLDFVDVYWQGWHFWAFNVADAAISIGVVLLILDMLGLGRRASNTA